MIHNLRKASSFDLINAEFKAYKEVLNYIELTRNSPTYTPVINKYKGGFEGLYSYWYSLWLECHRRNLTLWKEF